MAVRWDQHTAASLAAMQDELVRDQFRHVVGPFSPLWRNRLRALNRTADSVRTLAELSSLPALGERDVSPDGDPAGMAALVVQSDEAGFTLHAAGPDLRSAMWLRATRRDAYRRVVEADTRATSYVFSGLGFRYPIASTRSDLDVIARAGARLWEVLGLTRNDVLVSAQPPTATAEHVALEYAALGAGAPALFPGGQPAEVAAALRLAAPTVLAVPSASAGTLLDELGHIETVHTVLLVGAPSNAERLAVVHALRRNGAGSDVAVLAVHAPVGARLLWAECRQSGGSGGLHTYPDLDVVQVVDPETGDSADGEGELVLTQLGLRGSALVRWRTGDLVTGVSSGRCPHCGRNVPRVEGVARRALIARLGESRLLDLRAVSAALVGRDDIDDWRIAVGRRGRDDRRTVTVHLAVAATADESTTAVGAATDLRAVAGALPTQLIAANRWDLPQLPGEPLTPRILVSA